jgi:hypothetical protein
MIKDEWQSHVRITKPRRMRSLPVQIAIGQMKSEILPRY